MSTRLTAIKLANVRTRSRDLMFAAFVALAAIVGVSSIGTAINASHVASR